MRGEILGTAAYMSPEQAEGEPADERADIWAFGVCLLEALTGRRVFSGANASRVLASVLKDEPDFAALPPSTPQAVRRLLRRCLVKDRDQRLHDIADARLELEEAMAMPAAETAFAVAPAPRRMPRSWIAIAAAALVALGVAGDPARRAVVALDAHTGAGRPLRSQPAAQRSGRADPTAEMTITADGNTVVYVARTPRGLVPVRSPDRPARRRRDSRRRAHRELPLPLARRAMGRLRALCPGAPVSSMTLRKVSIEGGPSVELAKGGAILGASWGPDDTIVFGQGPVRCSA